MFCSNCACELPAIAKFCVRCGSRVHSPPATPPTLPAHATLGPVCVNCGKPHDPSHQFCNNCGQPLSQGQTQTTQPPPSPVADSEPAEITKFADVYSRMSGDELLRLSADLSQLRPGAQRALTSEIARRGLRDQQPMDKERVQDQGVGGWLTLFILSLTVFSPILTIINLSKEYDQFAPQAASSSLVLGGLIFDFVVSVALMSFGIYAGIGLYRVKPNAVRIAKKYLISYFLYVVLMILLLILGQAGKPQAEQVSSDMLSQIRAVFYVLIWYSYLEKSKRVAATYPTQKAR
jgi:hypothetical protein